MAKEPKLLEPWQAEDAARLKALFLRQEKSQAQFGYDFDIGTQGMVWQYLAARRPLNIEAAVAFAKGLNVGISEFSPTLAEKIKNASMFISAPNERADHHHTGPDWINPEAYMLLDLYYAADDRSREEIMNTAMEAKWRVVGRDRAANES